MEIYGISPHSFRAHEIAASLYHSKRQPGVFHVVRSAVHSALEGDIHRAEEQLANFKPHERSLISEVLKRL